MIVDRSPARAEMLARYRDETVQPTGTVAVRCTEHGRFILWVNPPEPRCRGGGPTACDDEDSSGRSA